MTTALNVAFYGAVLAMEAQLIYAICRVVRMAYVKGTPKYDVYYLILALLGMLVANSCYVVGLNVHLLPGQFSFMYPGYVQITYNFFQLFAIMFYGLYLVRNITFKNNLVQKTLMILLEVAYVWYLIAIPGMLDGNVWLTSSAAPDAFNFAFGLGQLTSLPKINNWLTVMLAVITLLFLALFVYASVKMSRSEKHARTFHDYMMFLLYCLTAFGLNVINGGARTYGVLFIALAAITAYKIKFFHEICRSLTAERLLEEARD